MKHLGTRELETERLLLRRLTVADAEAMYHNWASDEEVTRFLSWPANESVQVTEATLRHWESEYAKNNYYHWGIVPKEVGEPIGTISVVDQDDSTEMVHIGYCIGKQWWGKGYTSEALNRLLQFFFEEVGVNRIESQHDTRNPGSGRVMEKCGLQHEGTSRQSSRNNQGICDTVHYAILKEDYLIGAN
ncbi:GNAT family N-acetyltransferase [Atopococcus tabaci]|uniref:GNAT family N-acetyltransferase n=1 Tax=Atopococcus tabaci TaxID=269774 RepID=UPI00040221CD|nr:GNAT family N-acetyltransferase [Atopococcus tabaci]